MKDEATNNREVILRVAEQVFAEKGFDGARVDEIAQRAKVNKALIYYYFKSKEEMLSVIFQEALEESLRFLRDPALGHASVLGDVEVWKRYINEFLDFLETRQDVLRVMLMESLKRSPVNDLVFSLIEGLMQSMVETIREQHPGELDTAQVFVSEFFTGIMPCINFVVYHEKWMERFGVSEPELRERFFRAFLETHIRNAPRSYTAGPWAGDSHP
jgi:TetR/AcrR family transcriptional regulator